MILKLKLANARSLDLSSPKTYLQGEDLAGGAVNVEHGLVRMVGVDALPGEEVHDVVRPVLVAVNGLHLRLFELVLLKG